ncbi:unnamed protein product [Peniophora sp. CBMAI 1063]|nr:unnamed protein product [Peniophora sp. CBMAI 1063]
MTFGSILDSIQTNPSTAVIAQTNGSTDWLWAAFAVLLLTDILVVLFNFKRVNNYLLHQLAIIILTTASVAYFSMASNLGSTPIAPEFHGEGPGATRAIWYVRYIMWFINAPALLLMVYVGTGFPLGSVFTALFMTVVTVVCGLVGALVRTSYKWGYFVMGVFSLFYVIGHMWAAPSRIAFPSPTGRTIGAYRGSAGLLSFLALLYPLGWGLCEGGNEIGVVGEMIWYGVLDVLIFSGFVTYFLWAHHDVALNGYQPSTNARMTKEAEAGVTA